MFNLSEIPAWPQRQDSLAEQLSDLQMVAVRLGMYDAADAIVQMYPNLPNLKYGCHCCLGTDKEEPDGCVLDGGSVRYCFLATQYDKKEKCPYWKIVTL